MKMRLRNLCLAAAAFAATAALAAPLPLPPSAQGQGATDTIQGQVVSDPYRWLENWDDPKVQAWSDAQNVRTRAYLDALPERAAVKDKLTALVTATSPAYYGLSPNGALIFAMYSDPAVQQPMLVTLNANADPASRKVLLDPNALDAQGHIAIDWFVPSHDGTKVAVSLSKNGSEDGTLHVFDVATGKEIETPIPNVQYPTAGGSLAWVKGDRAFWYTRYPGPSAPQAEQHFHLQAYHHSLGTDWRSDPLVLGAEHGLERVSEVFLDNTSGRADALVAVQRGDGGEWAFYVVREGAEPVELATYADRIVSATLSPDGAVYGISRKGAPNGKIVKLSGAYEKGALGAAPVLVPEGPVAILSGGAQKGTADLTVSADRLFVRDIVGGPNQVRVFGLDGRVMGKLPLPEVSSNSEIVVLGDGDILYDVSTYLRPRYYARWTPATGKMRETALKVTSPVSFDDAEVVREFAISKDGTRVPVNIIRRKGTKLDGSNPTLLYGYGGYGVSQVPVFLGAVRRLWLDAGGVYAIANTRGGAEFGETWHEQGMLTHKQNVFDDFAAAGEHLIAAKYTSHDRLAMMGGSNGGLLMGAMITQHPALARTFVSAVGIYDMVRVELDPNGAFNTTEFGTVKKPDEFKALFAYSPYHHVVKGAAYPAVLLTTGATDGRVNPMHSRKFAAALQAATTSDRPILLRTERNAGHGIGSSLAQRIDEQTDQLTFLFDQLGMQLGAPGK